MWAHPSADVASDQRQAARVPRAIEHGDTGYESASTVAVDARRHTAGIFGRVAIDDMISCAEAGSTLSLAASRGARL